MTPVQRILQQFFDGESHVEIQDSMRGGDVFLVTPTCPPLYEQLFELLLLADTCRCAGLTHLTAVIPDFGYTRQDRRAHGREPVSARLIADLIAANGIQRVVVDADSHAVESAFTISLEHVSAIRILADAVQPSMHQDAVVVAPDMGAVKMAERYAKLLNLPVAIIHKRRLSGANVADQRIKERLILYGCGDFFNDYEGIRGYEEFRGNLTLMYFVDVNPASGKLLALRLIPTQVRRFRVNRAGTTDREWLAALLNREKKRFHAGVETTANGTLAFEWS